MVRYTVGLLLVVITFGLFACDNSSDLGNRDNHESGYIESDLGNGVCFAGFYLNNNARSSSEALSKFIGDHSKLRE